MAGEGKLIMEMLFRRGEIIGEIEMERLSVVAGGVNLNLSFDCLAGCGG